jgi:hypothetical protein
VGFAFLGSFGGMDVESRLGTVHRFGTVRGDDLMLVENLAENLGVGRFAEVQAALVWRDGTTALPARTSLHRGTRARVQQGSAGRAAPPRSAARQRAKRGGARSAGQLPGRCDGDFVWAEWGPIVGGVTHAHRLLVSLTSGPCLARLGLGARVVALTSAARAEACGSHLACVIRAPFQGRERLKRGLLSSK